MPYAGGRMLHWERCIRICQRKSAGAEWLCDYCLCLWILLEQTGVKAKIKDILQTLNTHDLKNLQEHGHKVRETI